MYGKVFTSIWDGSLYGHLEATATLMALVTLCNAEGVVDMTHEAISGRTGWPIDFVKKGIAELEAVDPRSRTDESDGRRLIRMDENRDWGWLIVNYKKYREKKDLDVEREQSRERVRRFRERNSHVSKGNDQKRGVTDGNAPLRQAEAEAEAEAGERERTGVRTPSGNRLKHQEGSSRPKGTRIPENWKPSANGLELPSDFDLEGEGSKFRDYWTARADRGGVKLDWAATWRNWVRRAIEENRYARTARSGVGPRLLT